MASSSAHGQGEVPLALLSPAHGPPSLTPVDRMDARSPDYTCESRLIPKAQGDSHGSSPSPISSKRSMHWPFSSSISTNNSPVDQSDPQTPAFPNHASILRRYASTRSAALLHRHTPSSASRSAAGNSWGASKGLRHGANPSISTIRTVASSSTLFPVPDYVANYIRGETPESMAERRQERAKRVQQRFPQIREGSMDLDEGVEGEVIGGPVGNKEMAGMTPQDGDGHATGARSWRRLCLPNGWRATMSLTLLLAVLLMVATAIATILMAIKHSDTFWTAESSIFTSSSCKSVNEAGQGAHGAASALGLMLVAGAGHAAQVLGAPTRNNVDQGHRDGRRLDVGRGLSIRNLKVVNMGRVLISLVVLVAAIGTLVVFNALLFTTRTSRSSSANIDADDATECSLTLEGALLGVVLIFLVLTAGILIVSLARPTYKPLLTIGDCIASFATRPDASLRHSNGSIVMDVTGRGTPSGQALVGSVELRQTRWINTVSVGRWIIWLTTWFIPFILALAALIFCFTRSNETPRLALGQPLWTSESSLGGSRSALVILVSLPQILVAVLFLSTSALLTAFFSARELGGYDAAARAAAEEGGVVRLRVSSSAEGMQTTSMYATLPPVASVILWGVFTAVGFLVSQSLVVVAVDGRDDEEATGVGLTPLALIVLIAVLAALGAAVLCISVFCHSAVPWDANGTKTIASLCRIWGAAPEEEERGPQAQQQEEEWDAEPPQTAWGGGGDRIVSWSGQSEAQRTIASGKWMAAGR